MLEAGLIINKYDTRMANKLQDMSQCGFKCLLKLHPDFDTCDFTRFPKLMAYIQMRIPMGLGRGYLRTLWIGLNCECFSNLETRYVLDI